MTTQSFGEWLRARSVNQDKMFFDNDVYAVGRNNADTADLDVMKIDTDDHLEFGILPVWKGLLDAATPNDALVTKRYVLNVLAGLRDPKDAVRVATTGNIDLASMPVSVDGVALNAEERFLVKNQTNAEENGIYTYPVAGAGNAAVRATDADEDAEVTQGMSTIVIEGLVNAGRQYALSTPDPIDVGVTPLTFIRVPNPSDMVIQQHEILDLTAADLDVNGYKDLSVQALHPAIHLVPRGGPKQVAGAGEDFQVSNVGGVTRLTFGLSGTPGTLGEKLRQILTKYGSSQLIVHYERLAN